MEDKDYKVKLEIFEGPLDLLLYLIKKDEIDIYDVSLERITKQYLDYIDTFKMLNIELASEFIVQPNSQQVFPFERLVDYNYQVAEPFQRAFRCGKVQRGLRSRFAPRGRYSWQEESHVQFNRWLVDRYRRHWPKITTS